MKDYQMDAVVSLRRNFADFPFDAAANEQTAQRVNERVLAALEHLPESYVYCPIASMDAHLREKLKRERLLPKTVEDAQYAECYLREDEHACVIASAEDHVMIAASDAEGSLDNALYDCQHIEQELKNTARMAANDQHGYLTALPIDAGSGMRSSVLLHLPMIHLLRQTDKMSKLAAAKRCSLSPLLPQGALFVLELRAGRLEAEKAIAQLKACAEEICLFESGLRDKAREKANAVIDDHVYRAYATASHARMMRKEEVLSIWSSLTLGYSLGIKLYSSGVLDALWRMTLLDERALAETAREQEKTVEALRAQQVRKLFDGGI